MTVWFTSLDYVCYGASNYPKKNSMKGSNCIAIAHLSKWQKAMDALPILKHDVRGLLNIQLLKDLISDRPRHLCKNL